MSDFIIENGILKKYTGFAETVVIPDGVMSIGTRAFGNCGRLTNVVIPDGVMSIGAGAFIYCSSLTSVVIPKSVTDIGDSAFLNCINLTGIVIPDSVTSIGSMTFSQCEKLADESGFVIIRNTLYSYHGKETCIDIPDGVTSIGNGAFRGCSSLTDLAIPNSVTSIGKAAFAGMKSLITLTDPIADNVKLKSDMFGTDVHLLTKDIFSLPVDCRTKAAVDFAEDERFKDVDRAAYLKYIKTNAAKLADEAMAHPALLTLMCSEKLITAKYLELYTETAQKTGNAELIAMMLDYNTKISEKDKEKIVRAKEKQDEEVFERLLRRQNKADIEGLIFAVAGKPETFKNSSELKEFIESKGAKLTDSISSKVDYLIMNDENRESKKRVKCDELGIEIIAEYRFNELTGRTSVIENGILKRYCGQSGAVVVPEGVSSIGDEAFKDFRSLTSVVIPDGVTGIGDYAFCGCSNLTHVDIPESVTSIGERAFCNCSSLSSAVIPDSVTSIGSEVFFGCSNLTHVGIPESVTSIGKRAFYNCSSLTNIVIPDSVTSIGESAFYNCSSLTSVVIPKRVTSIGNGTFMYCRSLTSAAIPADVKSIGDSAFWYCCSLSSIVIPESVTSIGRDAFFGCSSLTIRTPEGSYAAQYAGANNIKLELIKL